MDGRLPGVADVLACGACPPQLDFVTFDDASGPAAYRRPGFTWAPDSLDLTARLENVRVTSSDSCPFAGAAAGFVQNYLQSNPALVSSGLEGLLGQTFGTSAIHSYHQPESDVITCSTDDVCRMVAAYGSQRRSCNTTTHLCDILTIEPRRVNVMPDGLDIVVAATSTDPQAPLFATEPTTPTSTFVGARLTCGPLRQSPGYSLTSFDSDRDLSRDHGVGSHPIADVSALATLSGVLCDGTETGAAGAACICPQLGVTCAIAALGGFAPSGSTCIPNPLAGRVIQCCTDSTGTMCAANP